MKFKQRFANYLILLRPWQWAKNLAVFAAIIFTGQLFNPPLFNRVLLAFFVLCALSSASYVFNDLLDVSWDRRHPLKKQRPLAAGQVNPEEAVGLIFILFLLGFSLATFLGLPFVLLMLFFFGLHLVYTLWLKKLALWDIAAISISFIIRAFSGELVSGYHLPVWLFFTVVFLSLFIATGKRRGEWIHEGSKTRPTLKNYRLTLLDFYLSLFGVSTLLSYSLFTYFAGPQSFAGQYFRSLFGLRSYLLMDRKWLMLTVFPVIAGIMEYGRLVFYGRPESEQPEKLLAVSSTLLGSVFLWGVMIILIIYG